MTEDAPVFTTARLLLRPFKAEECEPVHAVLDCDEEVWRFDPGHAPSLEERRDKIARYAALWTQFGVGPAGAWCRETGALIGQGGPSPYLYEHRDGSQTVEFEVMYKLARRFWGLGYATEMARFWVDHCFNVLKLRRLCIGPERANTRSVAVLERLGARVSDDWLEPESVLGIIENPSVAQREVLP
ncbi:MAG: GNAT family N-acetyltransferase [Pseudomonadota bacterium]